MTEYTSYHEEESVAALAAGNTQAFDRIYYHYYEAVRANIFKIVKDESMTDDILSEVFINLWDKRERFAGSSKIGGWLFVSSFNRSMNYLRKQANERMHIQFNGLYYEHVDEDSQMTIQEEQYRLLEEAIASLPPQRRKIFELCRLGGKTYEEAARELNISKNTVKDHLSHANESIRKYIESHDGASRHIASFALFVFSGIHATA